MGKRLLRYQVDHLEGRIHTIKMEKLSKVEADAERATRGIKKPPNYSFEDMYYMIVNRIIDHYEYFGTYPKFSKTWTTENQWGHCKTFHIDKASGADKLSAKAKKKYDALIKKERRPFERIKARIEKRAQQCVDAIILQGSDKFEDLVTAFEKETF